MSEYELTFTITALAEFTAEKLSDDEAAVLAAAMVQFGDTLATIATSRALKNKGCEL